MIHQLVHTLSYGDAISTEVLALKTVLQKKGVESEIYAINVHPKYKLRAKDYREFPKNFSGEVILHYSLGSPLNELYQSLTSAKRTLIYHNITPSHWFKGINSRVYRDIEEGVKDFEKICKASTRILADSSFNASELKTMGCNATVLPLPVDNERWNEAADPQMLSMLNNDTSLHLLHVGRIAPNKKIEDIIKVFYFLKHYIHKQSKLWLVGIDTDAELYSFALKKMAIEFAVDDAVTFTGGVTDSEVRAFYEASSAYLCMSEHEGFCLPVAEAMHFGLPVVSYNAGALAETIGEGGVLFSEKRPAEIAALIAKIHTDSELKDKLVSAGKTELQKMTFDRFERNVKELFV